MTPGRLRVAGVATTDGIARTWSVADGSRGRRWRSTGRLPDGSVVSWVAETDPAGRFLKLEASSADRLLTLHREADGHVHGHVVGPGGIEHLDLGPVDLVHLVDPLSLAAAIAGIDAAIGVGEWRELRGAVIGPALDVRRVAVRVEREAPGRWVAALDPATRLSIELDSDGLPAGYAVTADPMEVEPGEGAG